MKDISYWIKIFIALERNKLLRRNFFSNLIIRQLTNHDMEAKDTKIYMIVDTEKIQPGKADEYVEFKDNRANPAPKKDPENFTSQINAGKKVFWFGSPKDVSKDTIEITEIAKKKKDEPIFLKEIGNDPDHRGAFMANVIDDYHKGLESYLIKFRIKGHKSEYEVDPKLEMIIRKSNGQ